MLLCWETNLEENLLDSKFFSVSVTIQRRYSTSVRFGKIVSILSKGIISGLHDKEMRVNADKSNPEVVRKAGDELFHIPWYLFQ